MLLRWLVNKSALVLMMHSLLVINHAYSTEMLPEVKDLLVIPPTSQQDLESNSYLDFMAINAPDDMDYLSIGKEIVLKNNAIVREAIAKQDNELLKNLVQTDNYYRVEDSRDSYQFPCGQLNNLHCVDQVINDRQQIERLLVKHKVLLARYQLALKKPNYSSYVFVAEDPIPQFHYLIYIAQLRLAQAILLIDKGQVRQGI